jgi:dihydrodipicolinate reductase
MKGAEYDSYNRYRLLRADGRMIIQKILRQEDMKLVGAITHSHHRGIGADIGELVGVRPLQIEVSCDLPAIISETDILIEFTKPSEWR